MKNVELDFNKNLLPLVKADPEGAMMTVLKLTDERQLAQALLAIAAAVIV